MKSSKRSKRHIVTYRACIKIYELMRNISMHKHEMNSGASTYGRTRNVTHSYICVILQFCNAAQPIFMCFGCLLLWFWVWPLDRSMAKCKPRLPMLDEKFQCKFRIFFSGFLFLIFFLFAIALFLSFLQFRCAVETI